MRSTRTLRRGLTAALLAVAFLFQGTWALAGVTGGITGYVHDDTGAPVVGATVTATSPSQTATATTDAQGHFEFLTLDPDTYTVRIEKDGYQTVAQSGLTVLADQTQTLTIVAPRALKVIATARTSAAALVKPGVGGDLYNVTPALQQASAALGGGGNLNNAYSAIAAVPGVAVGTGGMGWNQAVVIRGQNPWTTGFEYDGIPVNRAFDQYNTSTESNLGLQELQIYTGGGPVSVASSGISGFINQVIKTGTYPGFATLMGGVATDAFYHEAEFEAGGATPDRNFSYYVGISGYDQQFRLIDNNNGASVDGPGTSFANYSFLYDNNHTGQGVDPTCNLGVGFNGVYDPSTLNNGCLAYAYALYFPESGLTDRENVVNLHFGIPRADGQRDDIQFLWSASAERSLFNTSPDAAGPGVNQWMVDVSGLPYSAGSNYPHYDDALPYNVPFGTNIDPSGTPLAYQIYGAPNAPQHPFYGAFPLNAGDLYNNDTGALKLQWTHPFSDSAYMRVYAYSLFSDWTEDGENDSSYAAYIGFEDTATQYNLITHTGGAEITFSDQVNDQNLLSLTGNYETATTVRQNNEDWISASYSSLFGCPASAFSAARGNGCTAAFTATSPIGLISQSHGVYSCYDNTSGATIPCYEFITGADGSTAYLGPTNAPPAACAPGCYWASLWNYDWNGELNNVAPKFYNINLSEEWRPSDRLTVDVAGRYDNYQYDLANDENPQNNFYAQIVQNYTCINPATHAIAATPLGPGAFPPAPPLYSATCPTGYVHPNGVGTNPLFTLAEPNTYDINYWSMRGALTYQSDPDTVWRLSAGRFAEPPLTAAVQYVAPSGNNVPLWLQFMGVGFYSPFHPIPGETSAQYDGSLEHHFAGTGLSVKLTPFYGTTSNWEQQAFIGSGFVTQIPVGRYRNYGVEFSVQDGDFAAEGLSGLLSFTYTNAETQYQAGIAPNQIDVLNNIITAYNALTRAGGGSPCYIGTTGQTTCGAANPTAVNNPYYNAPEQALQDPNGWYPGTIYQLNPFFGPAYGSFAESFVSPYVLNVILNYRMGRLAITPSLQFEAGTPYGSPMDVTGLDPRSCGFNQNATGIDPGNYNCDYRTELSVGDTPYGYLYIPNPETGSFATIGQFNEPNVVVANIQATYDVSPKVRLELTAADLWHTCFGGSTEPWTTARPPSNVICGYGTASSEYVSNFYNGSGPTDTAINGPINSFELNPYNPSTGNGIGSYLPFNLYLQAQIHL